jgi:hypothetical protein
MTERSSMDVVWALIARARPHLTASQLRMIGATFQLHRREILARAVGLAALPDAELAEQLLVAARRMNAEGSRR